MADDDDQKQVERVTRTTVEVENDILCPETGEDVDFSNQLLWKINDQIHATFYCTAGSHSSSGIKLRN